MPMNSSEMFTPAEIIAFSEAFATSLSLLNNTANQQYIDIANRAIDTMEATQRLLEADISDDAIAKAKAIPGKIIGQLDTNKLSVPVPTTTQEKPSETTGGNIAGANYAYYAGMLQALVNAYHNAVTNQQQVFVTGQAALTMGITTLFSLDTSAAASAFKKKIAESA